MFNLRINFTVFFWLGAAFIRGRRLVVILLPSVAFHQGRRSNYLSIIFLIKCNYEYLTIIHQGGGK